MEGGRACAFICRTRLETHSAPRAPSTLALVVRHDIVAARPRPSMRPALIVILCDIEMQKELPPRPKSGWDRLLIPSLPPTTGGRRDRRDAMTLCR